MKDYFKKYLKYKKKYLKLIKGGAGGLYFLHPKDIFESRNDYDDDDPPWGPELSIPQQGPKKFDLKDNQAENGFKHFFDEFEKDIGFLLLRIKSNRGEAFDSTVATSEGKFGLPKWASFHNPNHEYGLAPTLQKLISELEKILKIVNCSEDVNEKLKAFKQSKETTLEETLKALMEAIQNTDDKTKKRFYRYLFFYKANKYTANEYKENGNQNGGADATVFILNELFQELLFYLNGFIDLEQQPREIIYIIIDHHGAKCIFCS